MNNNYLIIGDDTFLRDKETAKIKDKFLSSSEIDLNYSVHTPDDISGMMDSLGTMPFLAEKRVVVVKDAHELSEEALGAVAAYLAAPAATAVLVLAADGALKKTPAYTKLSGKLTEIAADKPREGTVRQWIRSFFTKEGVQITEDAVSLLVELKGQDSAGIKTDLEKLAAFSGGKKIEAADVKKLVGHSVTETIYNLVDAIDAKDAGWVFRILEDMDSQGKEVPEIIGYIASHIRGVQKAALAASQGKRPEDLAREAKMHPYRAKKLMEHARKYTPARIARWNELILETDREIKTGLKNAKLALEMLVVALMRV